MAGGGWANTLSIFAALALQGWTADPNFLMQLRLWFVLVQAGSWLGWSQIVSILETLAQKDEMRRPMWLPIYKAEGLMDKLLGGGGAGKQVERWEKTTMYEHEHKAAVAKRDGMLQSSLMPLFISFGIGVHIGLLSSAISAPINFINSEVLVRKYLFGAGTTPGEYGEVYTDPTVGPAGPLEPVADDPAAAAAAVAAASTGNASGAAAAPRAAAATANVQLEEAVFRTWESKEPVSPGMLDSLVAELAGREAQGLGINFAVPGKRWTLLHVIAGNIANGAREAKHALDCGANVFAVDAEGWTPLHWAAYHGNAATASALLRSVQQQSEDKTALRRLLDAKTKDDKTATDIALAEGSDKVLQLLRERDSGSSSGSRSRSASGAETADAGLRQRSEHSHGENE